MNTIIFPHILIVSFSEINKDVVVERDVANRNPIIIISIAFFYRLNKFIIACHCFIFLISPGIGPARLVNFLMQI